MSELALPPHLRGRLHEDWIWPLNQIPRGWNAYGPREEKSAQDYRPWPPRLIEGRGVARWEMANGSVVFLHDLVNKRVDADDVYGKMWNAVEMNPGMPDFYKPKVVHIPKWEEATLTEVQQPDGTLKISVVPDNYSPSALQKFSRVGWMRLDPDYYSRWCVITKRELPIYPEIGEDTVAFFRRGYRPDHVDVYYNRSIVFTMGLHWE